MAKKKSKSDEESEYFPGEAQEDYIEGQKVPKYREETDETGKPLPVRTIISVCAIILVIIIVLALLFNLLGQENNPLLYGPDGLPIKGNVKVSLDGRLISDTNSDGGKLQLQGNPNDKISGTIGTKLKIKPGSKTTLSIKRGAKLSILRSGTDYYVDADGTIHFYIDPSEDLNIDAYYDPETGTYIIDSNTSYDLEFEFVIEDPNTGEITTIDLEAELMFTEYSGVGCIEFSRTNVKETTHYGTYELTANLRISCEVDAPVTGIIQWENQRMGNIEVSVDRYNNVSMLNDQNDTPIIVMSTSGEYQLKIVFTPFKEFAGENAKFKTILKIGTGKAETNFDLAIDNLEQCVKISPAEPIIRSGENTTSIDIDSSSCASDNIEFLLCDNDPGCSGGSEEGSIQLSEPFFVGGAKKGSHRISITRGEIPGAYGVSVRARIPGKDKVLVDEKTIIVEPNNSANIVPDKFVVSFIGQGNADSIVVRNKTLAEDVPIQANVCNLYRSSLNVDVDNTRLGSGALGWLVNTNQSWWRNLITDKTKQSGTGKYVSALNAALGPIDTIRKTAQISSSQKNALIKKAYLAIVGTRKNIYVLLDSANNMKEKVDAMDEQAQKNNSFKNIDMAAKYVSLMSTAVQMSTSGAASCSMATTASSQTGALAGAAGMCPPTVATANSCNASAMSASAAACGELAMNAISLYNQAQSLDTSTIGDLHPEASVEYANEYLRLITNAKNHSDSAYDYAKKALAAAAIDSFTSASTADADAKRYLELAQAENEIIIRDLDDAKIALSNAKDAITVLTEEEANIMSTVTSYMSIAQSAYSLIATTIGKQFSTQGLLKTASVEALATSKIALSTTIAACAACEATGASCALCADCPVIDMAGSTCSGLITSALTQFETNWQDLINVQNNLSKAISGYETWRSMDTDLLMAISEALTAYDLANGNTDTSISGAAKTKAYLIPAIEAANWLSDAEKNSSIASQYTEELMRLNGNFNRARIIGLVGSAIANGFVNGAFEGGVYSTEEPSGWYFDAADTSTTPSTASFSDLKENCENIVSLTLPDYIINLPQDGKDIDVSLGGVSASWMSGTEQVYDVFNEQEMGVRFANNGLWRNGYGTVSFSVENHIHAKPTETSFKFGPFNVDDERKETKTYKYHFKFNSAPRTGNNFTAQNNDCSNELFRGASGKDALPKVLLSWDWTSINPVLPGRDANISLTSATLGSNLSKEPYLDATQLTILLSKKFGSLENILERAKPSCPENPARTVFDRVRPAIYDAETGMPITGYTEVDNEAIYCYLPLTTRFYDGKPALYYYLEANGLSNSAQGASDTIRVSDASGLMSIVDFNVNLMRDGYGTDFQFDFVNTFSTQILKAGPSFLDPNVGAKKYLYSSDRAYFTSPSRPDPSRYERSWSLPDAGKYRVRMLVDFTQGARLFSGTVPSAKIIFELYSLAPVSNSYSPFYYLPIDGTVGLSAVNSRTRYGSGITGGNIFDISRDEKVYYSNQQKFALAKIAASQIIDMSLLNAVPSLAGKLFDYTYYFNTTTNSDSNSKMILSPTVATPLIAELDANEGARADFYYSLKSGNSDVYLRTPDLISWTGLEGCSDLADSKISTSIDQTYALCGQKTCSFTLPVAKTTGKTYIKAFAYSPADSIFGIAVIGSGAIIEPTPTNPSTGISPLMGIPGIRFNDKASNSIPDSLLAMFTAVSEKNACIASIGNREVIFWPEEYLFKQKPSNTDSMSTKESDAKDRCVKSN